MRVGRQSSGGFGHSNRPGSRALVGSRFVSASPLVCPRCGAEMRVIAFITEPKVIKRIVDYLRQRERPARPPPRRGPPVVGQAVASPV